MFLKRTLEYDKNFSVPLLSLTVPPDTVKNTETGALFSDDFHIKSIAYSFKVWYHITRCVSPYTDPRPEGR